MEWFVYILIVVVLIVIVAVRKANIDYTIGSGMFKNSEYNPDQDVKKDFSDHSYYDDKGKLR